MLGGAIPYKSINEKNYYVKKLKRKYGRKLKYTFDNGYIIYSVFFKPNESMPYCDRYADT